MKNKKMICACCRADLNNNVQVFDYKNKLFNTSIFVDKKICVCPHCGFGFVNTYLNALELDNFYATMYRTNTIFMRKFSIKSILGLTTSCRALSQLGLVSLFVDNAKVQKILDIGAGYGDTFDVAQEMFPAATGYAFEPDNNVQSVLKNKHIVVFSEPFSLTKNYDYLCNTFDIIIMSHVLEHYNSDDIANVISKVGSLLSEQGVLLIEVPCDDFRSMGHLRQNDAPHLSFFSVEALTHLAEKAGLSIMYVNTCGMAVNSYFRAEQSGAEERSHF